MPKNLIIFDMDGVLVDVTESYRAAIQQTVQHFTKVELSNAQIQQYKNRGGFNDDWILSHKAIEDLGFPVEFQAVVDHFQSIFLGGLIQKERWIAQPGLTDRLSERATLAVFTGRFRSEAHLTLDRFAPGVFNPVVGVDDVVSPKPNPEGLTKIITTTPHENVWYVGDSIDDARAAQAGKVPFIGIASPDTPDRQSLVAVLTNHGAIAVLENINQMEPIVNQ